MTALGALLLLVVLVAWVVIPFVAICLSVPLVVWAFGKGTAWYVDASLVPPVRIEQGRRRR